MNLMTTGLQGLQNESNNILKSAGEIARASVPNSSDLAQRPMDEKPLQARHDDVVTPMIEMKQSQMLYEANAKSVSTADEMMGTLLDTLA